jgi:hypothetical protein
VPDEKWTLFGFMAALRSWMEYDPPPGDLLVRAAEFGALLEKDPETDAELEHSNLFFRLVPGTEHDGWMLSLTFALTKNLEVQCQSFICVRHPQTEIQFSYPPPRHHRRAGS